MAENKMLIDATHPEETRVVVLREGRVEEFDYESAARKLLRGSIFLAKITRVEPSLQAAFVDYGGNRHGFLAFNEIHPDYYQIPHADRQALIDEENAAQSFERDDDLGAAEEPRDKRRRRRSRSSGAAAPDANKDATAELEPAEADVVAAETGDTTVIELIDPDIIDQIEDTALDVSELLPPEPPVEDASVEDVAAAAHEAGESDEPAAEIVANAAEIEPAAPVADDIATAAASGVEADTEIESHGEVAAAEGAANERPSDDQPSDDDHPRPPKSIAAATPPDERIVSDTFEQPTEVVPANEADEAAITEDAPPSEPAVVAAAHDVIADEAVAVDDDGAVNPAPADVAEPAPSEDDGVEAAGDAGDDASVRADASVSDPASADDAGRAVPIARSTDDEEEDDDDDASDEDEPDEIDDVGDTDALEEVPIRRRRRARSYKIQEVIKRRQIVLVQVVKEERGNKGAALTTYLSLAGRYTVLMPNTARGGGISRKITNIQDRKRLKAIAQELDVPEGMGLIIRTAGAARTKQEIKRDFEYLLRLWESVRDLTLQSTAPSLVYEEGDLIKRSIRDLYSKDVEQVLVAGEEAHKEAKSFMRMLMPSHAKNVIKYEDAQPLFARYRIEQQLNAMFSPFVQLKSGGYLVINQTEALVAVDVNSGKSTRKFSIEDTALNTNLEAAEELSRQLKLRDLAGLIVIDFIDMEEKRNNRAVERRLKECLRDDRARIQVGRISHFGAA